MSIPGMESGIPIRTRAACSAGATTSWSVHQFSHLVLNPVVLVLSCAAVGHCASPIAPVHEE